MCHLLSRMLLMKNSHLGMRQFGCFGFLWGLTHSLYVRHLSLCIGLNSIEVLSNRIILIAKEQVLLKLGKLTHISNFVGVCFVFYYLLHVVGRIQSVQLRRTIILLHGGPTFDFWQPFEQLQLIILKVIVIQIIFRRGFISVHVSAHLIEWGHARLLVFLDVCSVSVESTAKRWKLQRVVLLVKLR